MAKTRKRQRRTQATANGSQARRSPSNLSTLSVDELQREIRRRQRAVSTLHRQRGALLERIAAIEAEILVAGGSLKGQIRGTGRTRPRNGMTLVQSLQTVLKGKTLSVTEAAEAVQAAGYRSTGANFRTMVNGALLKGELFKRVERGRYTAA